jgi:hypothetical protein
LSRGLGSVGYGFSPADATGFVEVLNRTVHSDAAIGDPVNIMPRLAASLAMMIGEDRELKNADSHIQTEDCETQGNQQTHSRRTLQPILKYRHRTHQYPRCADAGRHAKPQRSLIQLDCSCVASHGSQRRLRHKVSDARSAMISCSRRNGARFVSGLFRRTSGKPAMHTVVVAAPAPPIA